MRIILDWGEIIHDNTDNIRAIKDDGTSFPTITSS